MARPVKKNPEPAPVRFVQVSDTDLVSKICREQHRRGIKTAAAAASVLIRERLTQLECVAQPASVLNHA